jgi:lactocepin
VKKFSRIIAVVLALMLTLSFLPTVSAAPGPETVVSEALMQQAKAAVLKAVAKQARSPQPREVVDDNVPSQLDPALPGPDDLVRVIVKVGEKPLAQVAADNGVTIKSLDATVKAQTEKAIKANQTVVMKAINLSGVNFKLRHQYTTVLDGFSGAVRYADVDKLRAADGVLAVAVSKQYQPDVMTSVPLVGAADVWQDLGYDGTGMTIGIVDTGIDYRDEVFGGHGIGTNMDETRVVGGWNWADNNADVIDYSGSMHGTHVAGIAAANGHAVVDDATVEVKGMAPAASLLAEKVFSNDPNNSGAWDDDIIAGINHAVANGADVINLSLGSPAGFPLAGSSWAPDEDAIEGAVDAGVVVCNSAGNEAYSTSGIYNPYYIDPDIAMVGSSGVTPGSIQVASSQNVSNTIAGRSLVLPAGVLTPGTGLQVYLAASSNPDPVATFGDATLPVVDCGLGGPSDFDGKDVAGKIALIKRGTYNFSAKVGNAIDNGAAGAIVWNANPDPELISMATDPSTSIPAVFIMNTIGQQMVNWLTAGNSLEVGFNGPEVNKTYASTDGDTMSSFSSWGTSPDLSFKPDLTAPGGNIYSSLNSGRFESWNGTSMAAPHVTGAAALILQSIKNRDGSAYTKNEAYVWEVKTRLMNTGKVLLNYAGGGLPYSPRQQGAGRIQVDKAVATSVLAYGENGYPAIALKELDRSTRDFQITLDNRGAGPVTYNVYLSPVLTDRILGGFNALRPTTLAGAAITSNVPQVTVNPGETAAVTISLNTSGVTRLQQFAEGFITFTDAAGIAPELHVPYVGFVGDWEAPRVLDSHWTDYWTFYGMTGLYYANNPWDTTVYYIGQDFNGDYDPAAAAFSPNGDGSQDYLEPGFAMMRNAQEVKLTVKNTAGKTVATLGDEYWLRKNYSRNPYYLGYWVWDGTTYNRRSGEFEPVPEGHYSVDITAYPVTTDFNGALGPDPATAQVTTMPIIVDNTAPTVGITSVPPANLYNGYTLNWTAEDEYGLWGYGIVGLSEDGGLLLEDYVSPSVHSYTISPRPNLAFVAVVAIDNAGNGGVDGQMVESGTAYSHDGTFTIPFTAAVADVNVTVDGQPWTDFSFNPAEDGNTVVVFGLSEGLHEIDFVAYDGDGNQINAECGGLYLIVDTTVPYVTILTPDGNRPVTNAELVPFAFTVDDRNLGPDSIIGRYAVHDYDADPTNDAWTELELYQEVDGIYFADVPLAVEGRYDLQVIATDLAGNSVTVNRGIYYDATAPQLMVLDPHGYAITAGASVPVYSSETLKVYASDSLSGYGIYVNGALIGYVGRDQTPSAPLSVDVSDFEPGVEPYHVEVIDDAGNTTGITFTVVNLDSDSAAPELAISCPFNGALFNTGSVEVIGTASDEFYFNELRVNGDLVTVNPDGSWTYLMSDLADGDHSITAVASDLAGHTTTVSMTFRVDATAPTLVITSPADGEVIRDSSVEVTGLAGDNDQLASLVVNGSTVAVAGDGSWLYTLPAVSGTQTVTAVATDLAGNTTTASIEVRFNLTTAPDMTLEPAAGEYTTRTRLFLITGTVEPGAAPVSYVKIGTRTVRPNSEGFFSYNYSLREGLNTIVVKAHATDGQESYATYKVTLDSRVILTSVKITSAGAGFINVIGRTDANADVVVEVRPYRGSDIVTTFSGQAGTDGLFGLNNLETIAAGRYRVTVRATDPLGNIATKTLTVTIK